MKCRLCPSQDLRPYSTNPPHERNRHKGPCGPECTEHGFICWACRLFQKAPHQD